MFFFTKLLRDKNSRELNFGPRIADSDVVCSPSSLVIYLQLTLVDVDASLREIVAPETGFAGARVTAHSVDALLVAAARVLELPALVHVDAAAIPHESRAVDALLIVRCR